MKRLSVTVDCYRARKEAQHADDCSVPKAYVRKSSAQCSVDEKTVLYLCNRYILSEYGRRGSVAMQAVRFTGSVVVVAVESALWAQELWIFRTKIIEHINALHGSCIVRKVIAEVR